jgi:hypothetical protein
MKNFLISIFPTRLYLELKWYDYKLFRPKPFKNTQKLRHFNTENEGSYKPFDDKKAIFVHIPKCAGVSINKTLFGNLAGGHTTLEQYLTVFEPQNLLNYFKFTIVRNPWDRVVSAYFFLQQGGMNRWDKEFYELELKKYSTFEQFVCEWLVKPENIIKHHHFEPQIDFITDKYNKVKLDFIGYLENIDEDFEYICNKMKIQATLQNSNKSNRNNYQDYYSDETKAVVAEVYKQDIELLGYDFMNSRFN